MKKLLILILIAGSVCFFWPYVSPYIPDRYRSVFRVDWNKAQDKYLKDHNIDNSTAIPLKDIKDAAKILKNFTGGGGNANNSGGHGLLEQFMGTKKEAEKTPGKVQKIKIYQEEDGQVTVLEP
jgi:hypothetical protein